MVLSCRHCYEPWDSHSPPVCPSYMGLFVYGPAEDLKGMVSEVEEQGIVPGITTW